MTAAPSGDTSSLLLDRLQRGAIGACLVFALVAFAVTRGNWWSAASVLGGGVLVGVSFVSIRGGIDDLAALALRGRGSGPRPSTAKMLAKLAGRYALLGFLAYVMIARLRMHPVGLLAGASSVVAAAALEAGRFLRKNT